ncbi:MAG: M20/M25/M40 family metallo-hydrolase [Thermoleophilia bacterium]|nr:M20/M25/M40 family metallo-hydrolase [Thermoleophilia bacterium]
MAVEPGLRETVLAGVDALAPELVDTLSRAVRIESVNPKYPGQVYEAVVGGEGEVARLVAEVYRGIGCEVDLFAVEPGRENAVGVLRGAGGGRSLIYNGHTDVVPPGDPANWRSGAPFSGRVDRDRVWGRGSTDMKGGVLAQAFAARALAEAGARLRGDLILEAVAGEEVMDHECGVTATLKRGYVADAAVVSEPSSPPDPLAVVPVSPGLLWFSVTVAGKASHASMRAHTIRAGGLGAEVAVNAIDKGVDMYQALRRLEDEWGQTKRHPLFPPGHFTIHPGVVTGGPKGVLVPFFISEYMTLEYCCWYHPDDDPEDVKRELEEHVRRAAQLDPWLREHPPVIEWKLNWPAFSVDPEHPICVAVAAAHELAAAGTRFAGRPAVNGFAAVEDVSFLNLGGVTAISYGPGDLRVAHADDEYVLIDELVTATKTYALLALEWCGVA